MGNTFGTLFKVTTFGESHGKGVGLVIDGCPPAIELDIDTIQNDLARRRTGQSNLVSQRQEPDQIEILSGLFEGKTTGTPIAIVIYNQDQKPQAYDHLKDVYRPSHADYTYEAKYGIRDHRGGGRSSARETTSRVIAGSIAKQVLAKHTNISVLAWVSQIYNITTQLAPDKVTYNQIEAHPTRCPDPKAAEEMANAIIKARKDGDSLGGIISIRATGMPAGLGSPVFDRLEADLAKAMLSIPASKGFEIGSGFAGSEMTGHQHNDPFVPSPEGPQTTTNNSGGVQGGISNGQDLLCRVAFKPTATISKSQDTVNTAGEPVKLEAKGRHDPCVVPRAVVIVESMAYLVLIDHWLGQNAVDVRNVTQPNR